MPNQNGSVYGLTILSPILEDDKASPSHDLQIRKYLADLPTGADSSYAIAPGTHLCPMAVMDDVVFLVAPPVEEHLKSKYLIFGCNLDAVGESGLESYLRGLTENIPAHLDAIWSHCAGYPGAADVQAFIQYMKTCQIETTFFFAAVNNKSVTESLRALQTQKAVTDFIANHTGIEGSGLQAEFHKFAAELKAQPSQTPGSMSPKREIKSGGRNE